MFIFFAARDLIPSELAVRIVREWRLARLPGIRQREHGRGRWRYLLPLVPRYFARLRLDAYDTRGPRSPSGAALRALRGRLSEIDREASRGPDAYVAISEAVRTRIKRLRTRRAVDPSARRHRGHRPFPAKGAWSLPLGQPSRAVQHPPAVAEAFRGTPHRLTMVGTGPLEPALGRALPPNVEVHGWLPRREPARLFATASGFVHAGEEDFGTSMVEALCGRHAGRRPRAGRGGRLTSFAPTPTAC